jgi:hypothetical protein
MTYWMQGWRMESDVNVVEVPVAPWFYYLSFGFDGCWTDIFAFDYSPVLGRVVFVFRTQNNLLTLSAA